MNCLSKFPWKICIKQEIWKLWLKNYKSQNCGTICYETQMAFKSFFIVIQLLLNTCSRKLQRNINQAQWLLITLGCYRVKGRNAYLLHNLSPSAFLVWVEFDVIHTVRDRVTCNPLVSVISPLSRDSFHSADCTQVYIEPLSSIVIPGGKYKKRLIN